MAQFAEQLRGLGQGQGQNVPPLDATALEGTWDFVLTWNQRAGMTIGSPVRSAEGGAGVRRVTWLRPLIRQQVIRSLRRWISNLV